MFYITGHVVPEPKNATVVGLCSPALRYTLDPSNGDGQWRANQVPAIVPYEAFVQSVRKVAERDFPGKRAMVHKERVGRWDDIAYIRLVDKRAKPDQYFMHW